MDDKRERRIEGRQGEREERQRTRAERRRERWELRRNDPIGSVIGALVLIWLGVVFLAMQNPEMIRLPFSISWDNVWAFFLVGLGALLILEALLRVIFPAPRRIVGPLIWGIILLVIGVAGLFPGMGVEKLWPLALIAGGLGLLLTNVLRR
jgi:small-conductance mechanosensitive channel